jgi:hypothetical protein
MSDKPRSKSSHAPSSASRRVLVGVQIQFSQEEYETLLLALGAAAASLTKYPDVSQRIKDLGNKLASDKRTSDPNPASQRNSNTKD